MSRLLTEDNFAATNLRQAREEVDELLVRAIDNADRLSRDLRYSLEKFRTGDNPADTGSMKWTQADTLNETINHIENYIRNINFRDYARRQAALEVAQKAVDRVLKAKGAGQLEKGDDGGIDFAV